jgi:hypothetical protein
VRFDRSKARDLSAQALGLAGVVGDLFALYCRPLCRVGTTNDTSMLVRIGASWSPF